MSAEVVTAVVAFLGAGIGSAVASWATLRTASADRRERRRSGEADRNERRREEWGRRFSDALAAATSSDSTSRVTGRALLRELLSSDLAAHEDRRMAQGVLNAAATGRGASEALALADNEDVDDVTVVRDNGHGSEEGDVR